MKCTWLAAIAVCWIAFPALAQADRVPNNTASNHCADGQLLAQFGGSQSDSSGIVPIPPPSVGGGTEIVPPPVSPEAGNLPNELNAALTEFERIEELRENVTRRFSAVESEGECLNPASEHLTQLQREAEALLERLEAERAEYDAQVEALPEQIRQRSW